MLHSSVDTAYGPANTQLDLSVISVLTHDVDSRHNLRLRKMPLYIYIYVCVFVCECVCIYNSDAHKTEKLKLKDTLIEWNERNIQELSTTSAIFFSGMTTTNIYIYIYICIYICIYIYIYIYIYMYVNVDEGSLLPKYRDCTTSNDFESYLMCCGVMLQ